MGTTVDAVKLVMTSVISTEPWLRDPNVVRMPWNSEVVTSTLARANREGPTHKKRPLKMGVFWTDGVVTPQPPVRRALSIVHNVLKSLGYKVG